MPLCRGRRSDGGAVANRLRYEREPEPEPEREPELEPEPEPERELMAIQTVGEKVERDGYCLAMLKIADLAKALRRVPCGEFDYRFKSDQRWRICLNGGHQPVWILPGLRIPRFSAYVEYMGWPAGFLDAAGGTMVGDPEGKLLMALDVEIAAIVDGAM